MAQSIWKGHISFGLVSIPVSLYSAEINTDLHFNLLDSRNNARIRYERINEETGKEVPWKSIVKGYEYDDNKYVILTERDFEEAASKIHDDLKSIDIEDFIEEKELDYMYLEKPYYLVPDKYGEKGYVLLHEILLKTKKIGIATVIIKSRQYVAALMPHGDALVLNIIRYQQQLKTPDEFKLPSNDLKQHKITAKEMEIAKQLVDAMTTKWNPNKYHDIYKETLMSWIRDRIEHHVAGKGRHKANTKVQKSNKVVDIMSLLKKSVEDKKSKPIQKKQNS